LPDELRRRATAVR